VTRRPRSLSAARAGTLGPLLDRFERGFDKRARLGFDPVELPRRHVRPDDQEVAGLFAAALAYGRADLFKPVLERVLAEMGPSPAAFCDAFARSPHPAFQGFLYRFNRPPDLRALAAGVGHLRRAHGSLGERFAGLFREARGGPEPLRRALARFAAELRASPAALNIVGKHVLP